MRDTVGARTRGLVGVLLERWELEDEVSVRFKGLRYRSSCGDTG